MHTHDYHIVDSIPSLHNHGFPSVDSTSIAWSIPSHSIDSNRKWNENLEQTLLSVRPPCFAYLSLIRSISRARDLIAWLPFIIFSVHCTYFLDTLKICKMDNTDGLSRCPHSWQKFDQHTWNKSAPCWGEGYWDAALCTHCNSSSFF